MKQAYEFDSLQEFMTEHYRFKNSKVGLTKKNLFWLLKQRNITYHYSMTRDELFDLLIQDGMTPLDFYFEKIFCASPSDYVNRFNLSNDDFKKLKDSGVLKLIFETYTYKDNKRYVNHFFSLKQFFELTETDIRNIISG